MSLSKKTWVMLAALCSFASAIVHTYLGYHAYELRLGFAEGKSLCNVSDHLNCDVVSLSSYSTLLGLPVAIWGLATHLVLLFLLLIWGIGLAQHRERILGFAKVITNLILAASVVMGALSYFKLSTFCLFCITAYVLSALLWVALYFATQEQKEGFATLAQAVVKQHQWMLASLVSVPLLAFLIHWMLIDSFGVKDLDAMVQSSVELWKTEQPLNFVPNEGLIYTNEKAPVTMVIVEFADFLCPHCKAAAQPLHSFVSAHPGTQLIFKVFPLDGTCNPELKEGSKGSGLRCTLTAAAYCAQDLSKKGWEATDYIFENQASWSESNIVPSLNTMAQALTLDGTALMDCIHSSATQDKIKRIAGEGKGVNATPTLFVNGKPLRHGQIPAFLEAAAKTLGF